LGEFQKNKKPSQSRFENEIDVAFCLSVTRLYAVSFFVFVIPSAVEGQKQKKDAAAIPFAGPSSQKNKFYNRIRFARLIRWSGSCQSAHTI
jgi:hypothetical protein